jgi:hypothetical protein
MWQALDAMIDELSRAWPSGLQRLDVLRGVGLEIYVQTYMDCWDVSGMDEAQRSQVRPNMAAAIRGTGWAIVLKKNYYIFGRCRCTTTLWLLCKAATGCRRYPRHSGYVSGTADSFAAAHRPWPQSNYWLLQPEQTLNVLTRHRCHSGRPLAASTLKSYVSTSALAQPGHAVLTYDLSTQAALKHTEILRTKPEYRKARRGWVHWFKRLRDAVDAQYRRCASGAALPNRCKGYVPWSELMCSVRDQLPWGSTERLLLELHLHALGRSREYAAVRL